MRNENLALREEIDRSSMYEAIVGSSGALRRVILQIDKVAPTDSTVLISGETGTGKELIASAIHKRSKRSAKAFIRVNCAAIPPSLIASELFGHEKGAFTGAVQRRVGRFESADGGTIFLDEIGELSPEVQIALLRVLQEREFERVGSSQPISVDVRVLAATNRNLEAAVSAGTFREDLFYRLNVFPIRVPSLRERKDDIPLLVEYLVERYAKSRKEDQPYQEEDAGSFPSLRLAREHSRIAERNRACRHLVRRRNILRRREMAAAKIEPTVRTTGFSRRPRRRQERVRRARTKSYRGRIGGMPRSSFRPARRSRQARIPHQTLASKIATLGIDKRQFKVHPSKQASA